MRLRRVVRPVALCLAVAGVAAACGGDVGADQTTTPPVDLPYEETVTARVVTGRPTIGVAMQNTERTFFVGLESGARDQAEALGADLIITDAGDDAKRQVEDVAALIEAGVDGIIISPVDSGAAVSIADLAAAADIPMLAVANQIGAVADVGPQYVHPRTVGLVTNDDVDMGRKAAELTAMLVEDGTARILIVEGKDGAANAVMRHDGYIEGLTNLGVPHEVVASFPGDWTAEGGRSACAEADDYDVNIVFSMSDAMTAGCVEALAASGVDDVDVVSIGGNAEGIDLLTEGSIVGTVCQKPATMGGLAVELMLDALRTGQYAKGLRFYDTPIVTTDNQRAVCDPQW